LNPTDVKPGTVLILLPECCSVFVQIVIGEQAQVRMPDGTPFIVPCSSLSERLPAQSKPDNYHRRNRAKAK